MHIVKLNGQTTELDIEFEILHQVLVLVSLIIISRTLYINVRTNPFTVCYILFM